MDDLAVVLIFGPEAREITRFVDVDVATAYARAAVALLKASR